MLHTFHPNQLVKCIGDSILESLLCEVRQSKFYSVLADEAVDISVKEQMPIFLRFVDSSDEIREEFISFVHCDTGTTGKALSHKILSSLEELQLDLRMIRSQGYDETWPAKTKALQLLFTALHMYSTCVLSKQ